MADHMESANAQATVQTLILYAETKRMLDDPDEAFERGLSLTTLKDNERRYRRELINANVDEELLDASGDEIAMRIYEAIERRS